MFNDASFEASQPLKGQLTCAAPPSGRVVSSSDIEERSLIDGAPDAAHDAYWARWIAQNERNIDSNEQSGRLLSADGSRDGTNIVQSLQERTSCIASSLPGSPRHQVDHRQPSSAQSLRAMHNESEHSDENQTPRVDSSEAPIDSGHSPSPPPLQRQLRTRSAAQLKPFTLEHAKYTRNLLRNGWAGAVVSLPRRPEATADELRERADALANKPQDDLEGWLELESGRRVLSGAELAEFDARAAEQSEKAAITVTTKRHRGPRPTKARRRVNNIISDESDSDGDLIVLPTVLPGGKQPTKAKTHRRQRRITTSSQWPALTGQEVVAILDKDTRSSAQEPDLALDSASSDEPSELTTSEHEVEDGDGRDGSEVLTVRLLGKRKRALGRMMPAVFMKKAQADLRLMAAERDGDQSDGSLSSADELVARSPPTTRFHARTHIDSTRARAPDCKSVFTQDAVQDEEDVELMTMSEQENEGDAVAGWLKDFAPRRHAHTGDMITRYLTRGTSTRQQKKRQNAPLIRRKPLQETGRSAQDVDTRLRHKAHKRATYKSVAQDTSVPHPELAARQQQSESWSKFGKFSPDFGIRRLPVGLTFAPSTFIARGQLYSLLASSQGAGSDAVLFPPLFVADVWLTQDSALGEVEIALPAWIDLIVQVHSGTDTTLIDQADKLLHHLALFASHSRALAVATVDQKVRFDHVLSTEVSRLSRQLEDQRTTTVELEAVVLDHHLLVLWRIIDIKARVASRQKKLAETTDNVRKACIGLVRLLMEMDIQETMSTVQQVSVDVETLSTGLASTSAAAWVALVSLALSDVGKLVGWQEHDLWQAVTQSTMSCCRERGPFDVVAHELLAFSAFTLSALSQFTPSGVTKSSPRLDGDWIVVSSVLLATEKTLTDVDVTISNTATARRDRFLWNLLARCLVLVEQWSWKLDGRGDLLVKLFEVLKRRRFENLSFEPRADFARFLQRPETFAHMTNLQVQDDTALIIFLKLVKHNTAPMLSQPGGQKAVTRLFMRLSPMTSGSWRTASIVGDDCSSVLVNHYSLYLCFALIHRETAGQRLDQARRLLFFDDASEEERKTAVRAALYFIKVFHQLQLDLNPVIDWAASFASRLRTEYLDIQRNLKLDADRRGGLHDQRTPGSPLWQRAVLFAMIIRAMSMAWESRTTEDSTSFGLCLLRKEWTSQVFTSPLALDGLIGSEALNLINAYLDICQGPPAAHPHTSDAQQPIASQDDFDSQEFDFDDPSLNQMLGVSSEHKERDGRFAQFVQTDLAPSLFQLASSAVVSRDSKTCPSEFVQQVVQTWTRLVHLLVGQGLVEWSSYLRYGNQSWRRIINPVARREIGQLLAIQIIARDKPASQEHQDDLLDIWFQAIVAREVTSQHELTSALLTIPKRRPSCAMDMFRRAMEMFTSGESSSASTTAAWLLERRLAMIGSVFTETNGQLSSPETRDVNGPSSRAVLLNLHRSMLAAMKDQLSAIVGLADRREYATFCLTVLQQLRLKGAPELDERSLPEMRPTMTTIPSRLARMTAASGSWPAARTKARSLYRMWYRAAPEIVQLYALNLPSSAIRAKVRQEFERNALVDDLEAADVLLHKGYQELQETVNCWKMESHVMRWFANEELPPQPDNFLDAFYHSRDDPRTVRPTA
ncbi:hypothetical protein ACM66B_006964 [Microbotryomycetes sp. NB124-2]